MTRIELKMVRRRFVRNLERHESTAVDVFEK